MPDTAKYEKGKLYDVPINDLKPDPNQPRKSIDPEGQEEMNASVRTHGIIQPILFRQGFVTSPSIQDQPQPALFVVAGERRLRAAQQCGLATVPGICVEGNFAEIALVENLLRQDLTAIEEAEALQRLMEEQKYSQEQLAGIIGKARQTINEILLVNRLPQEIRDECRGDRKISRASLIEIARKKQVRGMQTAYEKYKEKVKKAAEGRTNHEKKPETAGDVMKWLSKAVGKLRNIDPSAWTEDEKNTFNQTLMELQETVRKILNPSEEDNAV
jgi:ParB family transcriptional regulator, chromosome partitioning protein